MALDRISEQPEMELFDGVRLVRDTAHDDGRSARSSDSAGAASAPEDQSASAATAGLDELVVNRIVDFFKSRSLQFKLLDNEPRLVADGKSDPEFRYTFTNSLGDGYQSLAIARYL